MTKFVKKPCKQCGSLERYTKGGRCYACKRELNRTAKARASARRCARRGLGWAPGESDKADALRSSITECAICRSTEPRSPKGWHADHDHRSGLFRGFLCLACNLRLGYAEKHGIELSRIERAYLRHHRRAAKAVKVVKGASEIYKLASERQKRKFGINGAGLPPNEQWRFEIDPNYRKALQKNPEAAQWLSVFNEEISSLNVYRADEPHIHTPEAMLPIFSENRQARRNEDALSYHRGPALEEIEASGTDAGDWLAAQTGIVAGDVEDALIEEIDRRAAVALRKEGDE